VVSGDPASVEGSTDVICVAADLTGIVVTATTSTLKLQLTKVSRTLSSLDVSILRFETRKSTEEVFDEPTNVEKSLLTSGHVFQDGLDPGTRYRFVFRSPGSTGTTALGTIEGWTTCECQEGDDAPLNLFIEQTGGYVMFTFNDNSHCEDGYAMSRKDPVGDTHPKAFAPVYYYAAAKECLDVIAPGKLLTDDLLTSQLLVGKSYEYCARAVGAGSSGYKYSSVAACLNHVVAWEASIDGVVTLDASAGSLPVVNVTVSWELIVENGYIIDNGSVDSGKDGGFHINFNDNHAALNNDDLFEVKLQFSKTTSSGHNDLEHEILCHSKTTDCWSKKTSVYLKHLDFHVPFLAIDDTSVPLTGKVVFDGTGCPISGAEVCLKDILADGSTEAEVLCVETDLDGFFSAPAVIATTVAFVIKYENHTFAALDPTQQATYDAGILIEEDRSYTGFNFKDITTSNLNVEVAGGLCDRLIGKATLEFKILGCAGWSNTPTQSSVKAIHQVPATVLQVRLIDMVDLSDDTKQYTGVKDHFGEEEEVKTIDLTEKFEQRDNSTGTESSTMYLRNSNQDEALLQSEINDEEDKELENQLVRFQYDGVLKSSLVITGDAVGTCVASGYTPGIPEEVGCNSFHVLTSGRRYDYKLNLEYDILPGVVEACDVVGEDLTVRMINGLGLIPGDNRLWAEYHSLSDDTFQELSDCDQRSGGCQLSIDHDENNSTLHQSNARAVHKLPGILEPKRVRVGPPQTSTNAGYLKYLGFSIGDNTYTACVLIEGVYALKELQSIGLPTHKPLLIIRDPPGGKSYSSYENVQTTIITEAHERDHFVGFESKMDFGFGWHHESSVCLGTMGFEACTEMNKVKKGFHFNFEGDGTFKTSHGNFNKEWSGGFSTTWSYQTSDDEFAAGADSDTFMVPNLNVKYTQIYDIIWNSTTCTASREEEYVMNLAAKTNKQALAFVSLYDVQNYILPKFGRLIGSKAIELNTTNEPLKIQEQLTALENGFAGWKESVANYTLTNALSSKDLPRVKNWFTGWVKDNDYGNDHEADLLDGIGHWAGLMPENLFKRAEKLNVSQAASDTAGALEDTYTLEFSGGGGLLEFHLNHEHAKQHVDQMGLPHENSKGKHNFFAENNGEFVALTNYFAINFMLAQNSETAESHTKTTKNAGSTEISFVLGDGDSADHFVVDIYTDPHFGTFLFKTTSGLSLCIHEEGTMPGALAVIQVSKTPAAPVLPDAPMVFQLLLQNRGPVAFGFELFAIHTTNPGNLVLLANGDTFIAPMTYSLAGEAAVFTTMTVWRGPGRYQYPALEIGFRLACDSAPYKSRKTTALVFNQVVEGERKVVFAEPCSSVFWAGLDDGYQIIINEARAKEDMETLQLTVFNPDYMITSFEEAINTTRLEIVAMKYRKLGDFQWTYSLAYDDNDELLMDGLEARKIDFSIQEDAFGYAQANWEYANQKQLDGTFEIMVETQCETVNGPAEFNRVSDVPLVVTVDRMSPKLHGYPLPKKGDLLWPGDEVVFKFNEAILCEEPYRFGLHVVVEGLQGPTDAALRSFDTDDLNVVCRDNQIGFTFDQTNVILDDLMGKAMVAVLSDVYDLAGNPYKGDGNRNEIYHTFSHAMVDANATVVLFDVSVKGACESTDMPSASPSVSGSPSASPSLEPSTQPSASPSASPSSSPSVHHSSMPSPEPSRMPSPGPSLVASGADAGEFGRSLEVRNSSSPTTSKKGKGGKASEKEARAAGGKGKGSKKSSASPRNSPRNSPAGGTQSSPRNSPGQVLPAVGIVRTIVAQRMGLKDASRIVVDSASCTAAGDLIATIKVYSNSARRQLGRIDTDTADSGDDSGDALSAMELARLSMESSWNDERIDIRNARVVIGENDSKERRLQLQSSQEVEVDDSAIKMILDRMHEETRLNQGEDRMALNSLQTMMDDVRQQLADVRVQQKDERAQQKDERAQQKDERNEDMNKLAELKSFMVLGMIAATTVLAIVLVSAIALLSNRLSISRHVDRV